MVQLIKYGALGGGEKYNINVMWIDGLADDTKPTDKIDGMSIPNGSIYTEVDTGKTYMFDRENVTWYEVSIGGGGGTQGGIVLVGETTTALTDEATTNPITVDGQSYTAQPNDAVIYGSKEFLFDGTKWHEFGDLSGLASKDIGAMTGYAKAVTGSAIATTDTLNQAIGKVEKRVDVNENNISKCLALEGGTALTSTADLNNITTIGNYYCSSNAAGQTIANRPTGSSGAFRLTVYYDTGTQYPTQLFDDFSTRKKWERKGNTTGTTFESWALIIDNLADYQKKLSSTTKANADYIDDTSSTHKFTTAEELEQIQTNKNNILTFVDPTAGDITFNSQLAQVPTVQAKYITQSGKTVNIQLYLDLGTAPTADTETVIGTLTGIDAPKNLYRGFCMVAAQYFSSDFETCFVGVGTTKSLYIKPKTGTTNTKYMINITYQTN